VSGDDGKWVVPALLVLLLVGVSTLGLAHPDEKGSPESIVDEWKDKLGGTIDGLFPRDAYNPCVGDAPPSCCVGKRVELEGTCTIAIPLCEGSCMRKLDMRALASAKAKAELEVTVEGETHESDLTWETLAGGKVHAEADLGPQAAVLSLSCAKSCVVDFK